MRTSIVLVAGYAASGKTRVARTLARRLPSCCYFDKDTLSGPFVDRLVVALGQPIGDRDSDIYRREVRPLEYQCLMAAGFEAAELGSTALLCAPFLHQLADNDWLQWTHEETSRRNLALQIIWVHCPREMLLTRMIERGSPRDLAKIANWDNYAVTVDENFPQQIAGKYLIFDNSVPERFDGELHRIVEAIEQT